MKRQHKISILGYMRGNFWLLIFPLIRGLLSTRTDFYHWIKGAYLDIIVIFILFATAYLKWRCIRFEAGEKGIYVKKGVIFRHEFLLPYKAICCAGCHQPIVFRPFNAVKISLDSDSISVPGKKNLTDVTLVISETDCLQIYNKLPKVTGGIKTEYEASGKDLVIFSLLFSSSLSGIIFLGTLFIRGSKLLGRGFEEEVYSAVNDVAKTIKIFLKGATPFSVALTMVIGTGWLFSFFTNLFHHVHFRISRTGKKIIIENGYFSKWKYYVNSSRINYADLRQNLLMKISRIMSVHVSCTGYGKGKNEIPVFVPVTTRRRVMSTLKMILPDFTQSNISIRPEKKNVFAYVWLPVILIVMIPVAAELMKSIFSQWREAINFIGMMLEIPSVYLLAVKIADRMTSGIGVCSKVMTIRYCRAYRFHTVIVPDTGIAYIKIRCTPFQRISGCCNMYIYTRGERVRRHRVRGIKAAAAEELAEKYGEEGKNAHL